MKCLRRHGRAAAFAPVHFASDRMLIYCGMMEPALSVDVFTGDGTSPELLQPSTDLICGEPCTVYVKCALASGLVPLSGEIFAVSCSDFAVIPLLCFPSGTALSCQYLQYGRKPSFQFVETAATERILR